MTRRLAAAFAVAVLGALGVAQAQNTPPGPPGVLQIGDVPSDQGHVLSVRFLRSADDGAGADDVTLYRVLRRLEATSYQQVRTVPAAGAAEYQFNDTGLTPGVTYFYRILAFDGEFDSDPLDGVGTPTDDRAPRRPGSLLVADHPDDNGRALDLTIGHSLDDGGGANDVQEYRLYRQAAGAAAFQPIATIPATGALTYPYVDNGVTPNVTYEYEARAFDGANLSPAATASGKAKDTQAPGPPSNVTVADVPADNGTAVEVSFNRSPDDGVGADDVLRYEVLRKTGANPFAFLRTVTATNSTAYHFTDSGLTYKTTYSYKVRAFDGTLYSLPAVGSGAPADNTPPRPPRRFKAVAAPNARGAADISFDASLDDASGHREVQRYEIFRRLRGGAWPTTPTLNVPGRGLPTYTTRHTGLTVGTTYDYRARAVGATGPSIWTVVRSVSATDLRVPAAPRNLTAEDRPEDNGKAVIVAWSRSPDDGQNLNIVARYLVFRQQTSVPEDVPVRVRVVTATGAASYETLDTSSDLMNLRSYTYWAVAVSGTGIRSPNSNTAQAVPRDDIVLTPPTNLTARDRAGDTGGAIELTWTRSTSDGGTIGPPPPPWPFSAQAEQPSQTTEGVYEIYRRRLGAAWPTSPSRTASASLEGNPLTVVDTGLPNNVTFEYRVRFRIADAISDFSNIASAAATGAASASVGTASVPLAVAIVEAPASVASGAGIVVKAQVEGSGASRVHLRWRAVGSPDWVTTADVAGKSTFTAAFTLLPGTLGPDTQLEIAAIASDGAEEAVSDPVTVRVTR